VEVAYAESAPIWLRPALAVVAAELDVLPVHTHPFWGGIPVDAIERMGLAPSAPGFGQS